MPLQRSDIAGGPQTGPPPKQITYPAVNFGLEELPDGNVALVAAAPGEVLVFPMPATVAKRVGQALTAPRVVHPDQTGGAR